MENYIDNITEKELTAAKDAFFFKYQKDWFAGRKAQGTSRTRFLMLSRQIGSSAYFVFEALEDAVLTGNDQIFISPTDTAGEALNGFVKMFSRDYFKRELTGDKTIKLSNGASIYFLSETCKTYGALAGNVYIQDAAYLKNFTKTWAIARGISMLEKHSRTLFTARNPHNKAVEALWLNDDDDIWRQTTTIDDAIDDSCHLLDKPELQEHFSPAEFALHFMCKYN